jgi:inositol phosphorylceramide mannosyltransferase catalytic subunit
LLSHWKDPSWGLYPQFGVPREIVQWAIICRSKHPLLLSVINLVKNNLEQYNPFKDDVGKTGVLRATGPIAFSSAMIPHLESGLCRVTEFESQGLVYSIYGFQRHRKLYKKHYSKVKSPLVNNDLMTTVSWEVSRRLPFIGSTKVRKKKSTSKGKLAPELAETGRT